MKIGIDIDDTVMNTFDVIEEAARYFDKYFLESMIFMKDFIGRVKKKKLSLIIFERISYI